MYSYGNRRFSKGRLIMGLVLALFAIISYYSSSETNPITGEVQRIAMSPEQEIVLGLQAVPEMKRQYGGLAADDARQQRVHRIGMALIQKSVASKTDWKYDFHVLADPETVNAFALPGGQIFITKALLDKLETDDQVAGVLAHEIVHVIARHGAQKLAKMQLAQGLSGAAVIASGDYSSGQLVQMVGQMVGMKYGREDELESDSFGVRIMHEAGFNPHAMVEVMRILEASTGGGRNQLEFFSTHPNPENRIQHIEEAIRKL